MNNIKAIAKVKETRITYVYKFEDREYEIETPKTKLNENVKDGEVVHIQLAVMPFPDSVIDPARIIDDE